MDPESAVLELDYRHAYIGGHVAESQRMLLLEKPKSSLVDLEEALYDGEWRSRYCVLKYVLGGLGERRLLLPLYELLAG